MKHFDTFSSKDNVLIIKILRPNPKKLIETLNFIDSFLLEYGDNYKVENFGLAKIPNDSSCLEFTTNLPYEVYLDKK